MIRALFISALLLFAHSSFASPELAEEFKSSWVSGYKAGKCGQNVMDLVTRAQAKGIDMSKAKIVNITNDGYIMSVMHRRNSGQLFPEPVNGYRFAPGIHNFYFHVVLENNGLIYDYDFGNEPQIVTADEYLRRMFIEEPVPLPKWTIFDKIKEREEYKVFFYSAEEYLNQGDEAPAPEIRLIEYYNSLVADVLAASA